MSKRTSTQKLRAKRVRLEKRLTGTVNIIVVWHKRLNGLRPDHPEYQRTAERLNDARQRRAILEAKLAVIDRRLRGRDWETKFASVG